MDALNSTQSRKVSPAQNMRNLEKAIAIADQRIRMRRNAVVRGQTSLSVLIVFPLGCYMTYHLFAPQGVMQNYKASSGNYGGFLQSFMLPQKSTTAMFRPEIEFKEQGASLALYTKRIEAKRANEGVTEGAHHPQAWY